MIEEAHKGFRVGIPVSRQKPYRAGIDAKIKNGNRPNLVCTVACALYLRGKPGGVKKTLELENQWIADTDDLQFNYKLGAVWGPHPETPLSPILPTWVAYVLSTVLLDIQQFVLVEKRK